MTESIVIQFAVSLPFMYLIKVAYKDVEIYNEENNRQQEKSSFTVCLLFI